MKRIILLLLATVAVALSIQAQFYGRHITIKKTNGDSIQYEMGDPIQLKIGSDGKPLWRFKAQTRFGRDFEFSDLDYISLRTVKEDSLAAREALKEFYQLIGGTTTTGAATNISTTGLA